MLHGKGAFLPGSTGCVFLASKLRVELKWVQNPIQRAELQDGYSVCVSLRPGSVVDLEDKEKENDLFS